MNIELEQGNVEQLLKGVTIPSPPQIVVDLQLLMLEQEPDITELSELISSDPGLAGGVLKIANSPAFGTSRTFHSILDAVMLLGLKTINIIVNTLCLRSELVDAEFTQKHALFLNNFWDSCSDIATIATLVADRINAKALRNDAYLLGLFHNVGILLMMKRFDNYQEILNQSYNFGHERIVDHENTQLGTNHSVIGYFVAKSWKTPKTVSEAIAKHHSVFDVLSKRCNDNEVKTLVSILKIAEHLSGFYNTIAGQTEDYEWGIYEGETLIHLDLTQDDVDDLTSIVIEKGLGLSEVYY